MENSNPCMAPNSPRFYAAAVTSTPSCKMLPTSLKTPETTPVNSPRGGTQPLVEYLQKPSPPQCSSPPTKLLSPEKLGVEGPLVELQDNLNENMDIASQETANPKNSPDVTQAKVENELYTIKTLAG
ncbi:hypothetical protein C0993_006531 [Termitomyces sp. T159_Od127]|nr:hypothetical protein C0993_006531 [Termitomyces sp. T159_Od127]